MTDVNGNPTISETVNHLRNICVTTNFNPCTVSMAGYLHGEMKQLSGIPKKYHYSVLEVVFGCDIYTFSQLTFHTCNRMIEMVKSNPDVRAMLYSIYKQIEEKTPADHVITPGEFKEFINECAGESIYAF